MKTNKKTQVVFLTLVFFVFLASGVSASVTIDIKVDSQFTAGERISFNYTFVSDVDDEISYMALVDCPKVPQALLEIKSATLGKDNPFEEEYIYIGVVREDIEPQNCRAVVGIIEPFEVIEEEFFEISTKPGFEFDVLLCKDQSCTEKSKIFLKNENMYLDYDSEVDNLLITTTLTYPDERTRTLTLPTSIKAKQIGTYTLDVTASKQGYKDITVREQFAVIGQEANILMISVSVCNSNRVCEDEENEQNCPQACAESEVQDVDYLSYIAYIILIITGILMIVFVINYLRKNDLLQKIIKV